MMRIGLFLLTNLAVLLVMSIVMKVFGIGARFDENGINYTSLMVMCFGYGMIGSMISLFISKWMAKRSMRVQVIDNATNGTEKWLVDTVAKQAKEVGIGMPEVGIFDSAQPNAFATGWNKNSALVAVSTGLLQSMTPEEVEAVLAHEIGHVANGDMVTLALIQGVVNAFVMFFARIIGYFVDQVVFKNESDQPGIGYFITSMVMDMVLGVLASVIVMWFSRYREFKADKMGAANNQKPCQQGCRLLLSLAVRHKVLVLQTCYALILLWMIESVLWKMTQNKRAMTITLITALPLR